MSFVTIHPRETESARLSLRHVPHDIMTLSPPQKKRPCWGECNIKLTTKLNIYHSNTCVQIIKKSDRIRPTYLRWDDGEAI